MAAAAQAAPRQPPGTPENAWRGLNWQTGRPRLARSRRRLRAAGRRATPPRSAGRRAAAAAPQKARSGHGAPRGRPLLPESAPVITALASSIVSPSTNNQEHAVALNSLMAYQDEQRRFEQGVLQWLRKPVTSLGASAPAKRAPCNPCASPGARVSHQGRLTAAGREA